MLIPKLNENAESFDAYFQRLPRDLLHVPEDIVRTWFWYHNEQALEFSEFYDFTKWSFRLESFSNDKIMAIRHYEYYLSKLDAKGQEFLKGRMSGYDTADFMLENGTFPCAILVAANCGEFRHHQSTGDEMVLEPYHVIEGQRRLGFVRALITADHPALKSHHHVWVATIEA
ncbi:hypothetical protein A3758_04225 [Oleiphilus sp. HI0118]|nr:hypothetical protein A3758_04225 [Oleiphilus sp. HI0118]KZZ80890.1 hypothetical protein A3767_09160 [Oleiphilus sp. HI0133]